MGKQGRYSPGVRERAIRLVADSSMSERMTRKLVLDALDMAVSRRRPGPGCFTTRTEAASCPWRLSAGADNPSPA